ncbi:hypothetical protein HK101_005902, partial [Irineochytrium annulatum]
MTVRRLARRDPVPHAIKAEAPLVAASQPDLGFGDATAVLTPGLATASVTVPPFSTTAASFPTNNVRRRGAKATTSKAGASTKRTATATAPAAHLVYPGAPITNPNPQPSPPAEIPTAGLPKTTVSANVTSKTAAKNTSAIHHRRALTTSAPIPHIVAPVVMTNAAPSTATETVVVTPSLAEYATETITGASSAAAAATAHPNLLKRQSILTPVVMTNNDPSAPAETVVITPELAQYATETVSGASSAESTATVVDSPALLLKRMASPAPRPTPAADPVAAVYAGYGGLAPSPVSRITAHCNPTNALPALPSFDAAYQVNAAGATFEAVALCVILLSLLASLVVGVRRAVKADARRSGKPRLA